jgi:myo-inositol 2-dehydrogenase/D-chiro-inositol 1-dehydrogenase
VGCPISSPARVSRAWLSLPPETCVWLYDAGGRVSHDIVPGFPERFAVAYLHELVDFVACVQEGRTPLAGGADARAALAVALAARRSLQEGRPVRVQEVEDL